MKMILLIPPSNSRGAHYHSPHFTDKEGGAGESSDLPVATQPTGWTGDLTLAGGGGGVPEPVPGQEGLGLFCPP